MQKHLILAIMTNKDYIKQSSGLPPEVRKACDTVFLHEYYKHIEEDIKSFNDGLRLGRITARTIINELKLAQQNMSIPSR